MPVPMVQFATSASVSPVTGWWSRSTSAWTFSRRLPGVDGTGGSRVYASESPCRVIAARGEVDVLNRLAKLAASWPVGAITTSATSSNVQSRSSSPRSKMSSCLLLTKLSKRRRKNVETALELVGLTERMHHQPRQLSEAGQRSVARAIVTI